MAQLQPRQELERVSRARVAQVATAVFAIGLTSCFDRGAVLLRCPRKHVCHTTEVARRAPLRRERVYASQRSDRAPGAGQALNAAAARALAQYGWVDRGAGSCRIPIDVAMISKPRRSRR